MKKTHTRFTLLSLLALIPFASFCEGEIIPDFIANRGIDSVNATITFTDNSTGLVGGETFAWSFPGGTPNSATGIGPHDITYSAEERYSVSYTITSSSQQYDTTKTDYITITNNPHVPYFTASRLCDTVNAIFTISDNTFGLIGGETFEWSFPGGTPSSAAGIGPHQVSYSDEGLYSLSYTVTSGALDYHLTKTDYIAVAPTYTNSSNPVLINNNLFSVMYSSDEITFLASTNSLYKVVGAFEDIILIKDSINIIVGPGINAYYDSILYFNTFDSGLWKSDGTSAGTSKILDSLHSIAFNFKPFNNEIYFTADDGIHGYELWKTDGTSAGTNLFYDFNPGPAYSTASICFAIDNFIYIAANDGIHGSELWKSDGTSAGTYFFLDILPGSGSGTWGDFYSPSINIGNMAIFAANDSVHGTELWRSDGTSAGTYMIKDINPDTTASGITFLRGMNKIGNSVYFVADDGTNGYELWKSDGTSEGTTMLVDILPGPMSSFYIDGISYPVFFEANGILYFSPNDSVHGRELWKSDGTSEGTSMIKDINPGSSSSCDLKEAFGYPFQNIIEKEDILYFAADDSLHGYELWRSDGTSDGTEIVADVQFGANGSFLGKNIFFDTDGNVLFFGENCYSGAGLWKYNVSTSTSGIKNNDLFTSVNIFPNPNKGEFVIDAGTNTNLQIKVMTILGEVVFFQQNVGSQTKVDLANNLKGIYFIQVITSENETLGIARVIVQ